MRPSRASRVYSHPKWQKLRKYVLERDGWTCVSCGRDLRGIKYIAHVDHIAPIRDRPDLAFSPDNLQSLCCTCHNSGKKLKEDRGIIISETNVDGFPMDAKNPWNAA